MTDTITPSSLTLTGILENPDFPHTKDSLMALFELLGEKILIAAKHGQEEHRPMMRETAEHLKNASQFVDLEEHHYVLEHIGSARKKLLAVRDHAEKTEKICLMRLASIYDKALRHTEMGFSRYAGLAEPSA